MTENERERVLEAVADAVIECAPLKDFRIAVRLEIAT
jgi:hypothetical protein